MGKGLADRAPGRMAYIGIKPCGHIVFACADDSALAEETAEGVAWCVKHGYRVERIQSSRLSEYQWCRCDQDKAKTQAEMFAQ